MLKVAAQGESPANRGHWHVVVGAYGLGHWVDYRARPLMIPLAVSGVSGMRNEWSEWSEWSECNEWSE